MNNSAKKAYYLLLAIILIFLMQPAGGTWSYIYNIRWLYVLILSFVASGLFVPASIYVGHKFRILDYPDQRKIHLEPIPRIGGIAIFAAFMIAIFRNLAFSAELIGLLVSGGLIFLLGLIDDIRGVSATLRLVVQMSATAIAIFSGALVTAVPQSFPLSYFFNVIITFLWFVGIINAVNFLDGIDGLVASFGIICSFAFFLIAWPTEQKFLAYMCIALAGTCAGFLPYNWHRAKIFLGDSGSTFIGFMLAGMAVMGTWAEGNTYVALSTPLLILGVPIFDMIYTTISRVRNGQVKTVKEWFDYVGKDHFHHRLLKIGFSVRKSVAFIMLVTACLSLGALIIREAGTKGSIFLLIQAIGIFAIVVSLMLAGRNTES